MKKKVTRKRKMVSDVQKEASMLFDNILNPEMQKNNPLYSFTYAGIEQALNLYDALQIKFTKGARINSSIGISILEPYFLLERICQEVPEEALLLKKHDKVKTVWVIRDDRFLPIDWPKQTDSCYSSMTHAAIVFVIDTYAKAYKAFCEIKKIQSATIEPEPDKRLLDCLKQLTGILPSDYKKVDFNSLRISVQKEIEHEYGLFARQSQMNQLEAENNILPDDLIDLAKAVSLYLISRPQLKRDIESGKITSYRKNPKGKHWISREEADSKYFLR